MYPGHPRPPIQRVDRVAVYASIPEEVLNQQRAEILAGRMRGAIPG